MDSKNNLLEKKEDLQNSNLVTDSPKEFVPIKKTSSDIMSIFGLLVLICILIFVTIFVVFTLYNITNTKIISGVHIKGINVSNLNQETAQNKVDKYIQNKIPEEIILKYGDFESSISTSQLNIHFDTTDAVNMAYSLGRQGNIFENNLNILLSLFSNINVEPSVSLDEEQLEKHLESISTQIPNSVVQSSYYIENNQLVITSGKEGVTINIDETIKSLETKILNLDFDTNYAEIIVKTEKPTSINIDDIYEQIHKEPVNAYYTQNPYTVYPHENGLDFNISIAEAKAILNEPKEEYIIPLKVLYPTVTTNMIGTEAFPDLLSYFTTQYSTRDTNRTTNLKLAASKINGTVLMPGETFSYNKVVGERTIAAGYKEAPIYVSGRVENGLGGGICQITTTLYNAVIYANLQIVERTNHQFVPSYVTASRDATVVYGAIDFKFKNNRNYPIKLLCSVSNGIAKFEIFGLRTDNEYEVEISSYVTSQTSNAIYSEAYKILKQNGNIVSKELLSKDTYKRH